ncbi:MAG: hypothetical protein Q9225_004635 [Loekoesia sp. 1 TL-2023]
MDLPTELRWQIYGYLLRPRDRLVVEDLLLACVYENPKEAVATTSYVFRQPSSRIQSSSAIATYRRSHTDERRRYGETIKIYTKVLLLNRQIRDEALDCLYGQHLQFSCSPDGVEAFFKDRPAETLRYITDIALAVPSETGRMKFMSLCSFIARKLRLIRLTVQINTFMWEDQPWERIQRAKDSARDLLKLDWVQSLLLITDLEALNIEFDNRYVAKNLTIDGKFTQLLRQRMLRRGTRKVSNRDDRPMETQDAVSTR